MAILRVCDCCRLAAAHLGGVLRFCLIFLVCTTSLCAADPVAFDRVTVPPMKTKAFASRFTLTTGEFQRSETGFQTTYEVRVVPWFFFRERGNITIYVSDEDVARLAAGETIEFDGNALTRKNKPRRVDGRAEPLDAASGNITVHIQADKRDLTFHGTYRFAKAPPAN